MAYVHVCAGCMHESAALVVSDNKLRHTSKGESRVKWACLWGMFFVANGGRRAQATGLYTRGSRASQRR